MKTLLLIALLSWSLPTLAQTKKVRPHTAAVQHRQSVGMDGLGRFKINQTTTAVIADLCKELDVPLSHGYSIGRMAELADSVGVMEIDYQSPDEFPDASQFSSGCVGYRAVYLPNYTIADIELKGLVLRFYQDKLVEIHVEAPGQLSDAFGVKYGQGALKVERTPRVCIFTHTGNKITYQDESFFTTWYNGGISALSVTAKYYNDNCEEKYLSFFSISDTHKAAVLEVCGKAAESLTQAKQTAAKKKKLSDL